MDTTITLVRKADDLGRTYHYYIVSHEAPDRLTVYSSITAADDAELMHALACAQEMDVNETRYRDRGPSTPPDRLFVVPR